MGKLSKKLVIYLDQNSVSEIAKLGLNDRVKTEFKELFDVIHRGFLEEKLVVPSSFFHEIETSLIPETYPIPDLKEKISECQAYMGQVRMEHKENIYTYQLKRAANDFLGIKNKSLNYRMAFYDDPDQLLKFYHVSVDMHLERFHNVAEREDLALKIDVNKNNAGKVDYATQLQRENVAYSEGFLEYETWRVKYLFGEDKEKIKEFAFSDNFRNIPLVNIGSKLWAKIFAAHGNRTVQSGDSADIEIISSYLPYVDVMVIDHFMASKVKELKLDSDYETTIFSIKGNGLQELIDFISDYLDNNPPVNVPDVTVFVLSDNKIKEDSFEFFRKLGSLCSRYYVDVYGFDDGKMPKYKHKDSDIEMLFSGVQEVHHIDIKPNTSKQDIIDICKEKSRSEQFLLIDSYRNLPDNFIETLIDYCKEGKKKILGYEIMNADKG